MIAEEDETCFFPAMHPLDNYLREMRDVSTGVPTMFPYKHTNRYRQLCDDKTMPTDEFVNVVKFNRSSPATETQFDKRPPQVTEVTRTEDTLRPHIESALVSRWKASRFSKFFFAWVVFVSIFLSHCFWRRMCCAGFPQAVLPG